MTTNFHKSIFFLFFICLIFSLQVDGENLLLEQTENLESDKQVKKEVQVDPRSEDFAIADRLKNILEATSWFDQVGVRVQEGVVFFDGEANSDESKEWATKLANKTEDVVAVVNNMRVRKPDIWDITPALIQLKELVGIIIRKSPLIILGAVLLFGLYYFTILFTNITRWFLFYRFKSPLLRDVLARALAIPVFLLGLFFIFYITGLSRLAMTLLGGTGLLGLVLGFAFRDIAENLLASILISIQRPFSVGDLIEVVGFMGYVQSVNTRATLLLTQEGNYVQIPNATIYKESITNFTANPQTRDDFFVGISYDDSISEAQSVALSALNSHEAVSKDPVPLVLVDKLDSATVNLRVSYWFDISKLSRIKVRSSVIRSVKNALDAAGVSLPDDAREVIFPSGVPIQMVEVDKSDLPGSRVDLVKDKKIDDQHASKSEDGLKSDAEEIQEQAKQGIPPESGTNLLN